MQSHNKIYIRSRYGKLNGNASYKNKHTGKSYTKPTDRVMLDKARYNVTKFAGEQNTLYDSEGQAISASYQEAYQQTREAAQSLADDTNGRAYIYDTVLAMGEGKLSDEIAHRLARDYIDMLEAGGYRVGGVQYAIHQDTAQTHIHMLYALDKTLQAKMSNQTKIGMRQRSNERLQEAEKEKLQNREHDNNQEQTQEYSSRGR